MQRKNKIKLWNTLLKRKQQRNNLYYIGYSVLRFAYISFSFALISILYHLLLSNSNPTKKSPPTMAAIYVAPATTTATAFLRLFIALLGISSAASFYLPGVAPRDFQTVLSSFSFSRRYVLSLFFGKKIE